MKNFLHVKNLSKGIFMVSFIIATFFLSTNASAQSYVSSTEAITRLKTQVLVLEQEANLLKTGGANQQITSATVNYYTAMVGELANGKTVADAISGSTSAICYSTPSSDCNPLSKIEVQALVDETKVFLQN